MNFLVKILMVFIVGGCLVADGVFLVNEQASNGIKKNYYENDLVGDIEKIQKLVRVLKGLTRDSKRVLIKKDRGKSLGQSESGEGMQQIVEEVTQWVNTKIK